AGGGLGIAGVEGTFEGSTGGGGIVIEGARGRARLTTGGGDIEVRDSDLSGSVSTGGGQVKLSRVKGGLRGSSGSGPVVYAETEDGIVTGDLKDVQVDDEHVQVGSKSVGYLHIRRAGGAVNLDDVPQGAEVTTGGGQIRIGRGAGPVEARTGGGDIEVGPIAGSGKASTGAGAGRGSLASVGGREQSVEVMSGTGTVIVELPGDLNARFDVETAYTESHPRPTRITSSWALDREPVSDWDSSQGTPRKYVRASGVAGKGAGHIYIKTVNGDIELRRVAAGAR